jgi:hypothetical protein
MKKMLAFLLLPLLFLSGCKTSADEALIKSAKAVEAISIAANDATKIVLTVMPENTEDRQVILGVIAKVVGYDTFAKSVILSFQGMENVKITDIKTALIPVLYEMRKAIDDGLVGIKNPESKKKAQAWLDALSILINTAQGMLEVYS